MRVEAFSIVGRYSYIGGKAVRKPGPNINQVVLHKPEGDNALPEHITIAGTHFSLGGKILNSEEKEEVNTQISDAGVIVQIDYLDDSQNEIQKMRVEAKKDDIVTLATDPDSPKEFCRKLKVDLEKLENQKIMPDKWRENFSKNYDNKKVKITVINADGQRAVWDDSIPNITPPRDSTPPLVSSVNE